MTKRLHNLLCRLGFHDLTYAGTDPDGRMRFHCYRSDYCRGRRH